MTGRPLNFLIVMADQLNGFSVGAYGNPVVKAPHMDRLAEQGVVFENAYCNSPLCAPSRFSMMAGRLPSKIGAYDNAALLPANVPTFAHYLRLMGYRTVLSGKMHFVGPDQLHGFEERLTTDIYPADFGWTPDWKNPGERIDWWYHNMSSVSGAGIAEATNQYDFDDEVGFCATTKLRDLARADDDRPFCLVASFTHPHDPYATRRKYWDQYDEAEIDLPRTAAIPHDKLDPHSQRLRHVSAMDAADITDQHIRNARRAYYGNVTYVDEWLGQLQSLLADTGLAGNTAVILLSDHGDMLGERGLWYKMSFFEPSARIPMIFAVPGLPQGVRRSPPASLVDLFPTLTDLAERSGAGEAPEPVDPLDGTSLVALMEGDESAVPKRILGEFLGEGAVAPCLMIRQGRHKFIHSDPDPAQLFDLEADPEETDNLAGRPEAAEIEAAFVGEMKTTWERTTLNEAVIADQRRRRLLWQALSTGEHTPWDFQPHRDASRRFMRNHLDLNDLERSSRWPRAEDEAS